VCVAKAPVFVPVRLRGISRKVFANQDAAEAWFAIPKASPLNNEVIEPPV